MKTNPRLARGALAIGLAMCALAFGGPARAEAAPAELSPSRIALDDAAVLRLSTDDGKAPPLPSVAGLSFEPSGQSSETTIINGAVTSHAYRTYRVVASRPGTYAIPVGGQTLRLEVTPAGSAPSPSAVMTSGGGAIASDTIDRRSPLALLRVEIPKRKLYVGQAVPITFKAYFRPGTEVTLTGAPSLGSSAFTISQLPAEPRQSIETVGGAPYRVAAWTGLVSAAMPGSYPGNATLPIIARYREPSRHRQFDPFAGMEDDDDSLSSSLRAFMSRSPFGGFDDPFAPVRQRELTLRSPAQPIEVLPLPTAGRPDGFSGAVGQLDVKATVTPSAGAAFEPLRLALTISGRGNFERVATTGLPASESWKSYPPRVEPGAAIAGLTGAKTFTQAVVPQKSGRVTLPPIAFSFFDPDRGRYVTRSTAPLTVDVTAAAPGSSAPAAIASGASADSPATEPRPNHADDGRFVRTLLPPYRRAWFWLMLCVPLSALAAATVHARRRGRAPSARARRRLLRGARADQRAEMRRAAGADDPVRFFAAAQTALQARLGAHWGLAPDEITAAEVQNRMGPAGASIAAALSAAEQLRYAGRLPRASSLREYDELLSRQLDQLEIRP